MPLYHASRLRRGRHSEVGHLYLLTAVTVGRIPLLADFALGRVLIQEMRLAEEQGTAALPLLGGDARSFALAD